MSSVAAFVSMVLVLSLVQVVRWRWLARDEPLRHWLATPGAWGGWAILTAVAVYILTLLSVEALR